MESPINPMSQNSTESIQSSEAVWSHGQLIRTALTSRPVVVLEKLKFDADSSSYRSAMDNIQIAHMCVKQEPDDIIPTLHGYDAQQGRTQNYMSCTDYKPTDVEIIASLPHHTRHSEQEGTGVMCSRSNQHNDDTTECQSPHKCDHNTKQSSSKLTLKQHTETHVTEAHAAEPYTCDISNDQTAQEDDLGRLLKTHTGQKPYECDQCGYQCLRKDRMKQHMKIHTGVKPYKCDHCDYRATRKITLEQHMRTHTGEKPYKCDHCEYRATQRSTLEQHIITHAGGKRYKCDQCDYRAARKDFLLQHIRTHTGERPYKCDQCGYRSAYPGDLNRHMRTHTGGKPYKCDQCDYRAVRKGALRRHMTTHTAEKLNEMLSA